MASHDVRDLGYHFYRVLTPALTGGFVWLRDVSEETNLTHYYLWLVMMIVPLSIGLAFPAGDRAWVGYLVYLALVFVLFLAAKLFNMLLHRFFDKRNAQEEQQEQQEQQQPEGPEQQEGSGGAAGAGEEMQPLQQQQQDGAEEHQQQDGLEEQQQDGVGEQQQAGEQQEDRQQAENAEDQQQERQDVEDDAGPETVAAPPTSTVVPATPTSDVEASHVTTTAVTPRPVAALQRHPAQGVDSPQRHPAQGVDSPLRTTVLTFVDEDGVTQEYEIPVSPSEEQSAAVLDAITPASPTEQDAAQHSHDADIDFELARQLAQMDFSLGDNEPMDPAMLEMFLQSQSQELSRSQRTRRASTPDSRDPAVRVAQQREAWAELRRRRRAALSAIRDASDSDVEAPKILRPAPTHTFSFLNGLLQIRLYLDRLGLETLLDRSVHAAEPIIATALALAVAALALRLHRFYAEVPLVLFCFSVASAHYSLLKSPQPDAGSSVPLNLLTPYSRAIYFSFFGVLVVAFDSALDTLDPDASLPPLYGIRAPLGPLLYTLRGILLVLLVTLPLVFLLGLLPQINTFLTWLLEQLIIHVLGGSGTHNLVSGCFEFAKSLGAAALLAAIGVLLPVQDSQFLLGLWFGLIVMVGVMLARMNADPAFLWHALRGRDAPDLWDILPARKLIADALSSVIAGGVALLVIWVGILEVLELAALLATAVVLLGFVVHYVVPRLRHGHPWRLIGYPVLRSPKPSSLDLEASVIPTAWFETAYNRAVGVERWLMTAVVMAAALASVEPLTSKWTAGPARVIITIAMLRLIRGAHIEPDRQWLVLSFSLLLFGFDARRFSESTVVDLFIGSLFLHKVTELVLKLSFVFVYLAPWNGALASPLHVVLQVLAVPHTALLLGELVVGAFFSSPLYPLAGAPMFLLSYPRPVKYWERSYKTRRVLDEDRRLADSLDPTASSGYNVNHLNSVFYEHMTRSLRHVLSDDLRLGRWGSVTTGDVFLLLNQSAHLTCLVHIIALGNGFVTFQLRGLEFRGTFCQERELEALQETPRPLRPTYLMRTIPYPAWVPTLLAPEDMLMQRWSAWDTVNPSYWLRGYNITINKGNQLFLTFDMRRTALRFYVAASLYYMLSSPRLRHWLTALQDNAAILGARDDMDPIFTRELDPDFDVDIGGVSLERFQAAFGAWVAAVVNHRVSNAQGIDADEDSALLSTHTGSLVMRTSYAMSLVARRVFWNLTAAVPLSFNNVDRFIDRYYTVFKGDVRITSVKDEWVFIDPEGLLQHVVTKGARVSLQLHRDQFVSPGEYDDVTALIDAIERYDRDVVLALESEAAWRAGVLGDKPHLLTLRRQKEDSGDAVERMIVSLELSLNRFKLIRLNRECVRSMWTSQIHELVFLQNQASERGSIQQMRAVVRNLLNQSCDLPVGYPIFVSDLTTSFATKTMPGTAETSSIPADATVPPSPSPSQPQPQQPSTDQVAAAT